jgi:hypothetical protein|tara:strand:+ start:1546 stop:1803 length:258 start_codon:yes stop_codon:yes gene_type:complete
VGVVVGVSVGRGTGAEAAVVVGVAVAVATAVVVGVGVGSVGVPHAIVITKTGQMERKPIKELLRGFNPLMPFVLKFRIPSLQAAL